MDEKNTNHPYTQPRPHHGLEWARRAVRAEAERMNAEYERIQIGIDAIERGLPHGAAPGDRQQMMNTLVAQSVTLLNAAGEFSATDRWLDWLGVDIGAVQELELGQPCPFCNRTH